MWERRQASEQDRWISCRECGVPLELDVERMERLGGRVFLECGSCRQLIWIRQGDLRRAHLVGALRQARRAGPPTG